MLSQPSSSTSARSALVKPQQIRDVCVDVVRDHEVGRPDVRHERGSLAATPLVQERRLASGTPRPRAADAHIHRRFDAQARYAPGDRTCCSRYPSLLATSTTNESEPEAADGPAASSTY